MATGIEMMMKSVLGIDPDMIKQGAAEMQQALQTLIAQYKSDQIEQRVIMARIEAKLDMLIAERQALPPARIMSEQEYARANGNGALPAHHAYKVSTINGVIDCGE